MGYDSYTDIMLEESADALENELSILANSHLPVDDILITHNGDDTLIVYAPHSIKAYVPKKYQGWNVEFVIHNGGELQLDIDSPIDFEI